MTSSSQSGPLRLSTYEVGVQFSVDNEKPPGRNALHGALEAVRSISVEASSAEQAEAHADLIRIALEHHADR
jgi:hypothetical protein